MAYVVLNKMGKFSTSDGWGTFDKASVYDQQVLWPGCLCLEVYMTIEISPENCTGYVSLTENGLFVSKAGDYTEDLQEAAIFDKDDYLHGIAIPVTQERKKLCIM